MVAHTVKMFTKQFGIHEATEEMQKSLEAMAANYLQQKDGQNSMNIYNQLHMERVMDIVKQNVDITVKKVPRDEFNKLAEA
jgi:uncharacterized protein YutE (UPF0331/DUF86 family)